jgi:multidrug efflux pump subunit AcrB
MASANEHDKGEGGNFISRGVNRAVKAFDRFQARLEDVYEKLLKFSLKRPKTILTAATAIFFGSLVLAAFIPKTFLPTPDNGEFQVNIELPPGASLEKSTEFMKNVEGIVRKSAAVNLTAAVAGNLQNQTNKASVYVHLKPKKERPQTTSEVKQELREQLSSLQKDGYIVKVDDIDIGGGNQQPFQLVIQGENLDDLSAYVDKLKARMMKIPGLVDVDTNFRVGQQEFQVIFDRSRSEALGVSTATAGPRIVSKAASTISV